MSITEMKNLILFQYDSDISYWYRILGEMFEKTDGFTKPAEITGYLDGQKCVISWDDYSWDVNF